MKHKHHIVPKHMGGTDDESNLVELTIEEHAEAHKKLFEEHGRWQDYIAWKGLAGLLSSDECKFIAMMEGSVRGSAISNGGFKYTNGKEVKKFMPWEVPDGWERIPPSETRKRGIGSGTKGRKWFHDPTTGDRKALLPDEEIPNGWIAGQGKGSKSKSKCYWYTDGTTEGQFKLDGAPKDWQRGRLKGVYGWKRVMGQNGSTDSVGKV